MHGDFYQMSNLLKSVTSRAILFIHSTQGQRGQILSVCMANQKSFTAEVDRKRCWANGMGFMILYLEGPFA